MWSHLKEKSIFLPKISSAQIIKEVKPVLLAMEKVGIMIDVGVFKKLSKKLDAKIKVLEREIKKEAGEDFNISSPIQLKEVLFEKLKLPHEDLKRTKTGISTAAMELRKIAREHKIIKPILEYRELTKLLSTYLKPLPSMVDKNSRLHTNYGQDTSTGRITSEEPNLQNIPIKGKLGPEIRAAFVAKKGYKLISADYSQIELRVVACLAQDKVMIEAFSSGQDIHTKTASELFGIDVKKVNHDLRRIAKTVNFGVLYGMSPYGLSQALGIDQDKAAKYIERYFHIHSGIKNYCNRMIDQAKSEGYIETLFGFRRDLPNINSPHRMQAEAEERIAINTPVQGTAAEILKLAMIHLADQLQVVNQRLVEQLISKKKQINKSSNLRINKKEAKLLLSVHDELVIEAPTKEAKKIAKIVKDTMEGVVKLCIPTPVDVGIGDNWGECK